MSEPLFRKEVMEARRASWLGGISLAQPLRLWVLTLAGTVAAGAIIAFLLLGTYTRRSSVTGQLVPAKGLATVLAPATGVVGRLDTDEGGQVKRGQVLAVVTVPSATLANGDTHAAIEQRLDERAQGLQATQSAQLAQLTVQELGLRTQLDTATRELAHLEGEVATRRQQVDLANEVLQRYTQLQGDKYVSVLQIRQQQAAVLEYTSDMQALQRATLDQRRSIAQLQQQLRPHSPGTVRRQPPCTNQQQRSTPQLRTLSVITGTASGSRSAGQQVNEAVKRLALTKVIVAHRPETIASAGRVLVMERGRIAQDLPPQQAPAAEGPVEVAA